MRTRIRAAHLETTEGVRLWVDETCWADLPQLDQEIEQCLLASDGWAEQSQLHRELGAGQRQCLDALVTLFTRHGLAAPGPPNAPLSGLRLAVVGSGPLARQLATALLRAGVDQLEIMETPHHAPTPASSADGGAAALVRALRPRHRVVLRSAREVVELSDRGVHLAIVAPSFAEANRWVLRELVRHDIAHLVIGCTSEIARIGPWVMPGRTPCMGCHDLVLASRDPLWAQSLAQLELLPSRPDPTLSGLVTAQTVLRIGWFARGACEQAQLPGVVEIHDIQHPGVRRARFPQHDDCACRWPG